MIVFGIPEAENETREDIQDKVLKSVLTKRLGVTVSSVERIHRLGRKKADKDRPIIMRLYDYNEKIAIFNQCKKLKGSEINISHDYSQETLEKRRLLWQSAQKDKKEGAKVKLVHDKLDINGTMYTWDKQSNARARIRSNNGFASRDRD